MGQKLVGNSGGVLSPRGHFPIGHNEVSGVNSPPPLLSDRNRGRGSKPGHPHPRLGIGNPTLRFSNAFDSTGLTLLKTRPETSTPTYNLLLHCNVPEGGGDNMFHFNVESRPAVNYT